MRRWNIRAALHVACPGRVAYSKLPAACGLRRISTQNPAAQHEQHHLPHPEIRRTAIFAKLGRPKRDVDAWTALLDGALPPHLRDWSNEAAPPTVSASDLAAILLEAQHPQDPQDEAFDLLFHLGFNQGRWTAVVWLVKKLVEKFPVRHGRASRLSKVNAIWDQLPALGKASLSSMKLEMATATPQPGTLGLQSLDELTSGAKQNYSPEEMLGHDALGQIWRTLGAMTKACAGGEIRPEVLEIIALLHHQEVMPMSIYQSERNTDSSAIRQPPLVSLLSSRILTSLSDAAWRAHEKLVVEEAKAMGGEYADLRPEVPGAVYRVRVAGLRPEVWMELILWSCIRGGWIISGADILRSITQDTKWKTLSWQDYEQAIPAEDRTSSTTWAAWEHVFKTREPSTRDAPSGLSTHISRTISAELVNAYIDALVSSVSVSVGRHGIPLRDVISRLYELKRFLQAAGSRSTLSTGSWDALALRLIDSQGAVSEHDAATIRQLVALSPGLSKAFGASNTQYLPAYVLDGNMAMHGLLNLALRGQIAAGSFEGALAVFNQLESRMNSSRNQSLEDFLGYFKKRSSKNHPSLKPARSQVLGVSDMFTSNFGGIDYPELKLQIPPTTLAQFLKLATEVKAFDFGRFLLYRDDVESGPLIDRELYEEPYMQPALIQFAAEADDQDLLDTLKGLTLGREAFMAVLITQLKTHRWDAARRVLQHLTDAPGRAWGVLHLAHVMRAMLLTPSKERSRAARKLFDDMIYGCFENRWNVRSFRANAVRNLAVVFSAIGDQETRMCAGIFRKSAHLDRQFDLSARAFNLILEGVLTTHGSAAGKALLSKFWSVSARKAQASASKLGQFTKKKGMISEARSLPMENNERQRVIVKVPGAGLKNEEVVVYGSLAPNTETFMIVLRHALDELAGKQSPTLAETGIEVREIVKWAVRRLAELPFVESSIVELLRKTLTERGLDDIIPELPEIVHIVEDDLLMELDVPMKGVDATI